jgi:hypothetical protein
MAEYKGTFFVQNNTNGAIRNVSVMHRTTDYGPNTLFVESVAQGGTAVGGVVQTSTTNKDRWAIAFTNAAGELKVGAENCGFEAKDDGHNVLILLNNDDFDIVMPDSSSSNGNKYE